ncbi:helix-turn-helix domain-containing protein [Streptomyces sp. NPDC056361]|uniref:helix-turn-helix domain-containing protein n=1 Tax=Streptomyces sp. NPDC056361 TaxID=3345795 RepID=UPI0035D792CB
MRHQVCDAGGRCQWFYANPDARLRPGVGVYRGFRSRAGTAQEHVVVPTGRVSLLIGFGGELRLARTAAPGGAGTAGPAHRSVVSGLHTRARVLGHRGDLHGIEVTLAPWAAYRLFGTSLRELADTVTDPADVLGGRVRDLAAALEATHDWRRRFALLDETLLRWSSEVAPEHEPSPAVLEAWRLLGLTAGTVPVRELADRTGWSLRHLENRFREQIGLAPKSLARVLRLNRAIRELAAGERAADTALACGFYDQSHLSREFSAMTGLPPGRFLAAGNRTSAWLTGCRNGSPGPSGSTRSPGSLRSTGSTGARFRPIPGTGPRVSLAANGPTGHGTSSSGAPS